MKLLIVDDDGLIRDSLKILFETKENWTARTAENGEAALRLCEEEIPDIILMDIRMPVCDGVEATRKIKTKFPDVKIIMLTTFTDDGYIASAISAGAEGYLLKSTPADGIIERIRAVEKGALVFDKGVKLTAGGAGRDTLGTPNFPELSQRENEILSLVATGLSNNEIAAKLFLSQGTVRNSVSVILEKLNLRDRTQLAVYYWKNI
ncbi:MAG: response regulator transcription factor [Oscillospiraceae bacterium]|jgi:DNA-binding NarL/FixJ family response regulator|nr:response regulator transcription factor [Oscillospiraceae bacterium]